MKKNETFADDHQQDDASTHIPIEQPGSESALGSSNIDHDLNIYIEPLPSVSSLISTPTPAVPSTPGAYFTNANNSSYTPAQKVPFSLIGAASANDNRPEEVASTSNTAHVTHETSPQGVTLVKPILDPVAKPIDDPGLLPQAEEYNPDAADRHPSTKSEVQARFIISRERNVSYQSLRNGLWIDLEGQS